MANTDRNSSGEIVNTDEPRRSSRNPQGSRVQESSYPVKRNLDVEDLPSQNRMRIQEYADG